MKKPVRWRLAIGCLATGILLVGCKSQLEGETLLSPFVDRLGSPSDPDRWTDHTQGMPYTVGYKAGMQRAVAEGKPAMVFLTTTWCGWCKRMSKETLADPDIQSMLTQNFILVLVDGDAEPNVVAKYGKSGYPHLVFLSPDEQILDEQKGFANKETFYTVVQDVLNKVTKTNEVENRR